MCECNKTFIKHRQNYACLARNQIRDNCECCCKNNNIKPKVKGKFGVAYVVETPSRKCKPCGWEVEFNDTPSRIESNCKKMMNWITCPPLGEFQYDNNSESCFPTALSTTQPVYIDNGECLNCCRVRVEPNDGCCCKKASELHSGIQNCTKTNETRRHCCKSKEKPICCNSKNESIVITQCKCCAMQLIQKQCGCQIQREKNCCCGKSTKTRNNCCSSEQNTLDCCCRINTKHKSKRQCNCDCKTFENTRSKLHPKRDDTISVDEKKHEKTPEYETRDKTNSPKKTSKNFIRPDLNEDKQIPTQRSPYTITTTNVQKKGPDKHLEGLNAIWDHTIEFENVKHIKQSNGLEDVNNNTKEKQNNKEIAEQDYDEDSLQRAQSSEYILKITSNEENKKEKLEEATSNLTKNIKSVKSKENYRKETEIDPTHSVESLKGISEHQLEASIVSAKNSPDTNVLSPPRKKHKAASLLKLIKQEHKKEIEAIHYKAGENKT